MAGYESGSYRNQVHPFFSVVFSFFGCLLWPLSRLSSSITKTWETYTKVHCTCTVFTATYVTVSWSMLFFRSVICLSKLFWKTWMQMSYHVVLAIPTSKPLTYHQDFNLIVSSSPNKSSTTIHYKEYTVFLKIKGIRCYFYVCLLGIFDYTFLGNDSYLLQDLEVVQNIVSAKSTNTPKLCQLKVFYLTR